MRWKVPGQKQRQLHNVWEEPEKTAKEMISLKILQPSQQDFREPEELQSSERSSLEEDRQFKAKSWRTYFREKKQSPTASREWTDWTWNHPASGELPRMFLKVMLMSFNMSDVGREIKNILFFSLLHHHQGAAKEEERNIFQIGTKIPFWIISWSSSAYNLYL